MSNTFDIKNGLNVTGQLSVNSSAVSNKVKIESTATNTEAEIDFYNGGALTSYIGTFGSTHTITQARGKTVFWNTNAAGGTGQLFINAGTDPFKWNITNFADTATEMQLNQTGLIIGGGASAPTAKLQVEGNSILNGNADVNGTLTVDTATAANYVSIKSSATNTDTALLFYNGAVNTGYFATFGTTNPVVEARGKTVIYNTNAAAGTGMMFVNGGADPFKWNITNFADTATEMQLDTTGLIVGGGATSASAKLHVKGSAFVDGAQTTLKGVGATAASTALLIQNSGSTSIFEVKDDGTTTATSTDTIDFNLTSTGTANGSWLNLYNGGTLIGSYAAFGSSAGLSNMNYSVNYQGGGHFFRNSLGGAFKFVPTGGATDADVDMKFETAGLIIGTGVGGVTPSANLHVSGTTRLDGTTTIDRTGLSSSEALNIPYTPTTDYETSINFKIGASSVGQIKSKYNSSGNYSMTLGDFDDLETLTFREGNMGINEPNPTNKLHISTDPYISGTTTIDRQSLSTSDAINIPYSPTAGYNTAINFKIGASNVGQIKSTFNSSGNYSLSLGDFTDTDAVTIRQGNVGINQTAPTAKLHVSGSTQLDGTVRIDNQTVSGATAGAGTLPANPVGFITINLDGTDYRVPYYNT